ncbi:MAG TPA: CpsD/CapB family tyrosine-protein kinase [Candidatus Eubacterium faecipullorum]|uniref:non-specific protein-tyrosine kinase n=1 Tax=Candidatus Eubacterium faecipullorum TaxID=2838571 RepID=A0A9D1UFQ2_9FIRM|nr:CpsD/CapB family tyrosine-protein kinase [Candidatus Eubacterium faecipullorum]
MAKKGKKKDSSASNRFLLKNAIMDPGLKFRVEEAYKSIRTNIMLSVMKKGCKTIVITSSVAGEGKTTTTTNLAISISQADQRVLLIDGDLRKPKVHHYFSIPNAPGLTNYLGASVNSRTAQKVDLFSIIHPTEYKNLSVIASGSIPPNPAEILGSEPMADFLKEVAEHFDYIIIDTPPINVVSDALPVIRESDGVVVVVRSNASTHPELQKALDSLKFIDAKILGFVVNYETEKKSKYGYYGKYGYYKYGYGDYTY